MRKHRFFHITELSHVSGPIGDRPGRTVRTAEDDRRRGGRRQERLPRRDDQPAGRRRRSRARAASRPRRMRSASSCATAASPSASRRASPALDTDDVRALAEAGAEIRHWIVETPFPADLEAAIRAQFASAGGRQPGGDVRGALVGDGRGPARRVVRRPAGDLPQRRAASTTCCTRMNEVFAVALQRPRDQLPRAQGLRARRRRAVGRRAAHGALATSAPPA